jgi:hypothetical protein
MSRYLQKNFVKVIENLDQLVQLDTLNLSNNSVRSISGLGEFFANFAFIFCLFPLLVF